MKAFPELAAALAETPFANLRRLRLFALKHRPGSLSSSLSTLSFQLSTSNPALRQPPARVENPFSHGLRGCHR